MIEITMISGKTYYKKMEQNTERSNVGDMQKLMSGKGNAVEAYSTESFSQEDKVFLSPFNIESFRIIL